MLKSEDRQKDQKAPNWNYGITSKVRATNNLVQTYCGMDFSPCFFWSTEGLFAFFITN